MTGGWNFTEAQCKMFLFPVILAKLERWLSSFKLPKLTCTCNVQIACWFFLRNMLLSSSSYQRTLDSRTRATSGRDLSQSFYADSQKIDIRKASLYFFFSKKLALLSLLKEVKPSPGRKIIKPLTLENFFPPTRHYRKYKTRSRRKTTITFSRQNFAGSRARSA